MTAVSLAFDAANTGPLARAPQLERNHARGRAVAHVPHKGIYLGLVACFGWMFVPYLVAFATEAEAAFSVVVSILYTVMYFAVPGIAWRIAKPQGQQLPEGSFREFLAGDFQTCTGRISGWDAAIQIWSIPAALALASTGIIAAMFFA
jgi:hypothetical protein